MSDLEPEQPPEPGPPVWPPVDEVPEVPVVEPPVEPVEQPPLPAPVRYDLEELKAADPDTWAKVPDYVESYGPLGPSARIVPVRPSTRRRR